MSGTFVPGLRRTVHALGEGFKGLVVSPGQTLACMVSLAVAGCLVALSASFGSLAVDVLDRAGRNTQVLVYLKEGVPARQVTDLMAQVRQRADVASVTYLSAEQDRAQNAALLPADVVASMPADAIPGQHAIELAFRSEATDPEAIRSLAAYLKSLEGVDVVAEPPVGAARVQALASAVGFARVVASMLAALLLTGTLFFVVGTLTRTMDSRHEEMAILRLLGATDVHLKAPLYVQGMSQGLLGLLGGALAARTIAAATNGYLAATLGMVHPLPFHPVPTFAVAAVGGLALGALGAAIASARRLP